MLAGLGERWERLGQREQRMFSLLGVTAVIVGVLYVAFTIQDGLSTLERHNEDARRLLASLEQRRDELMETKTKQGEAVGQIGNEPVALNTYLENVGKETNVSIRAQTEKPTVTKGKFIEHSVEINMTDLTLDQLARFLKAIETQSPIVVTRSLNVTRSTLVKEKIDRVKIVVATYSRGAGSKKAAAGTDKPATEGEAKP